MRDYEEILNDLSFEERIQLVLSCSVFSRNLCDKIDSKLYSFLNSTIDEELVNQSFDLDLINKVELFTTRSNPLVDATSVYALLKRPIFKTNNYDGIRLALENQEGKELSISSLESEQIITKKELYDALIIRLNQIDILLNSDIYNNFSDSFVSKAKSNSLVLLKNEGIVPLKKGQNIYIDKSNALLESLSNMLEKTGTVSFVDSNPDIAIGMYLSSSDQANITNLISKYNTLVLTNDIRPSFLSGAKAIIYTQRLSDLDSLFNLVMGINTFTGRLATDVGSYKRGSGLDLYPVEYKSVEYNRGNLKVTLKNESAHSASTTCFICCDDTIVQIVNETLLSKEEKVLSIKLGVSGKRLLRIGPSIDNLPLDVSINSRAKCDTELIDYKKYLEEGIDTLVDLDSKDEIETTNLEEEISDKDDFKEEENTLVGLDSKDEIETEDLEEEVSDKEDIKEDTQDDLLDYSNDEEDFDEDEEEIDLGILSEVFKKAAMNMPEEDQYEEEDSTSGDDGQSLEENEDLIEENIESPEEKNSNEQDMGYIIRREKAYKSENDNDNLFSKIPPIKNKKGFISKRAKVVLSILLNIYIQGFIGFAATMSFINGNVNYFILTVFSFVVVQILFTFIYISLRKRIKYLVEATNENSLIDAMECQNFENVIKEEIVNPEFIIENQIVEEYVANEFDGAKNSLELISSLTSYFESEGLKISNSKANELISAMLASRLIVLKNSNEILLDKALNCLRKFFGTSPISYDMKNEESFVSMLIKSHQMYLAMQNNKDNVNLQILKNVNKDMLSEISSKLKDYFLNPELHCLIKNKDVNINLPSNLWFIIKQDKNYKYDESIYNYAFTIDLDLSQTDALDYTLYPVNYECFSKIKNAVINGNLIPPEAWNVFDVLEQEYSIFIKNNILTQVEIYLESYFMNEGIVQTAMDSMIANKFVPYLTGLTVTSDHINVLSKVLAAYDSNNAIGAIKYYTE